MSITIRTARCEDAPLVLSFINELAAYERLAHEVVASVGDLTEALFGKAARVFCDLIEHDGSAIGFALWFYNFSTFLGRHGIYLEDLYVRPEVRGLGAGKALLAHLAQKCIDENLGRLEWAVLDWNEPAITFYERIGSEARNGWTTRRLAGQALAALAAPEVVA